MDERALGKILTFYSYKGGTGRSMAVANYACWLIRRLAVPEQRVLMMDWDLEAPGLHRYFVEKTALPENFSRPGIINYFNELQRKFEGSPELYERLTSDGSGKALLEEFPLDEYVIRDVMPGADLIKAGRLDPDYAQLVSSFNWIEFFSKHGKLFDIFRNLLGRLYAFCLIDSRTGFNDISGICTMVMPEKLVAVFTPNYQNVYGVLDLAERAVNYRRSSADFRPLAVFPLPSRIENAELDLKSRWREEYQKEFEARLRLIYQLDTCSLGEYFDKTLLPHVSYYAYGEEIALLKEERGDTLSLRGAYEQFFQRLTDQDTAWEIMSEIGAKEEKLPLSVPDGRVAKRSDVGIYISYAHIDNRPMTEEQGGWVNSFHQALETRLAQLLGEEIEIWRDQKVQGADQFNEYFTNRIDEADVFIPILSPRYFKSQSVGRELEEFLRSSKQGSADRQSGIFKVIKTPIQQSEEPPELQDLLSYQFYEVEDDGRPREFASNLGSGHDFKFLSRIDDLAFDIVQLIKDRRETSQKPTAFAGIDKATVYLAETTSDLSFERDSVKRELQHFGYKVLPDRGMPSEVLSYATAVREQLARSSLSIHLVGKSYGVVPEGEEIRSVVTIQEELAAERASSDSTFLSLVWMPIGLSSPDERQQRFIKNLQNNLGTGAELLQSPLEALKTLVLEKLSRVSPPMRASSPAATLTRIYLICDSLDATAVREIDEYLFDRGFEIISSLGEGEGTQSTQYHREILLNCDAVLIYYGVGSQLWLRSRLWDLQKAKGLGRTKPMLATAIYIGEPYSPEKTYFKTHEAIVINGLDQDVATALQPFIAQTSKLLT